MSTMPWGLDHDARLAAIHGDLAQVSTATACHMLVKRGWRNTYMLGLLPLQPLGTGRRMVGGGMSKPMLSDAPRAVVAPLLPTGPPKPTGGRPLRQFANELTAQEATRAQS